MHFRKIVPLIALGCLLSLEAANFPKGELKVINICSIQNRELSDIMEGKRPDLVVEFSANTVLPLHLFINGGLVHLINSGVDSMEIQIIETFYVRSTEEGLLFSGDLSKWGSFTEFATGNFSVILSKSGIDIRADASQRL